eukprot:274980_1
MNAFPTNQISNLNRHLQWITITAHQNALNKICNGFTQQMNTLNQKYTSLCSEYESAMQMIQQQQNQIKISQNHCITVESKLNDITRNYRKIIPETIYHNTRDTPGNAQQTNILKYTNILLFGHRKYCYSYDNVINLFNDILKRFDNHEYDIQQSLFCVQALSRFKRRWNWTRKISVRIATAANSSSSKDAY